MNIRQFLKVVTSSNNGTFAVMSEPSGAARSSRYYKTEAEAQAFIDGYEARDQEDEPIGDETQLFVTGLLDEVEFMGAMPDQHGKVVYGPFDNLEVAKYHARTLSTDPDEAVVVSIRKPL